MIILATRCRFAVAAAVLASLPSCGDRRGGPALGAGEPAGRPAPIAPGAGGQAGHSLVRPPRRNPDALPPVAADLPPERRALQVVDGFDHGLQRLFFTPQFLRALGFVPDCRVFQRGVDFVQS